MNYKRVLSIIVSALVRVSPSELFLARSSLLRRELDHSPLVRVEALATFLLVAAKTMGWAIPALRFEGGGGIRCTLST